MYKTDYFVRFVNSESDARSDLERGYSFAQYSFWSSREDAENSDYVEFYGYDADDIVAFERETADGTETVYGFALAGLCGFGPFETADEAIADAKERRGYNGCDWPMAAIYTGRYVGEADGGDGDMFRPRSLVTTIDFEH